MGRVGFLLHPAFLEHDMGAGHPESPERLRAIRARLENSKTWLQLHHLTPRRAERRWLETIHRPSYIDSLERRSPLHGHAYLDPDTSMSPGTLEAAYLAAGAALTAVDEVIKGEVNQAFCAVRPPGHHAEADRAMGFCFFNSVAIAAKYIQQQHGLNRVLIVDWDVHHGNGTQHSFYEDPSVLFFSTHQFPHYPGTGRATETGEGAGKGFTVNVPLPGGQGDEEYGEIFRKVLVPAAEAFRPQFVLISAGFDEHRNDPLASMDLTDEGYGQLTKIVAGLADRFAEGRMVSCLEGGYHLEALAGAVEQHLLALLAS